MFQTIKYESTLQYWKKRFRLVLFFVLLVSESLRQRITPILIII